MSPRFTGTGGSLRWEGLCDPRPAALHGTFLLPEIVEIDVAMSRSATVGPRRMVKSSNRKCLMGVGAGEMQIFGASRTARA